MNWEIDEGPKLRGLFQETANFFGVEEVVDSKRIGGNANKNYMITTDTGQFVFKIILEKPLKDLQSEVIYLNRLKEYNFPAAYYIQATNGSTIFQHEGQTIVALPKLDDEIPIPTAEVCMSIGQNIARLHQVPMDSLPERNHWWKQSYLPESIPLVQSHFLEMKAKITKVFDQLKDFPYTRLPKSIVHGDMFPNNCLYRGNELVAFLDWEEIGIAPSVLDLAYCILNFCFEGNKFNRQLYKNMIEGYQQVRALTTGEKHSLLDAVRYVGLSTVLWRLLKFGVYHPDEKKLKDYDYYWKSNLDNLQLPI